MKAAIYSPYLDTLGGGERYVISFAKVLADNGWVVDVESEDGQIIEKLSKRFGLKLPGIRVAKNIKRGEGYDLCFWLSDGSIPNLLARKNILHFQRPFYEVDGKNLINRMKFFKINTTVVNSEFTKKWIDKEYPVSSVVLYPPVDIEKFKAGKKENLIICIARFSQLEQSKRQDILIEVFKRFYDTGSRSWKLILAGGSEVGRDSYVDRLIKSTKGYPIEVIENPNFEKIKSLYKSAKVFWSASGFNINESREPQKVEHFGITVVEAMASKCIPIVYNAGGHKEIIEGARNGFLWEKRGELLKYTKAVASNISLVKEISSKALEDSKKYSYEKFSSEVLALL